MTTTTRPFAATLTPRQREVLRLLLAGASDAEIGAALCIAPGTVQRHVEDIHRAATCAGICPGDRHHCRWIGAVGLRVGRESVGG